MNSEGCHCGEFYGLEYYKCHCGDILRFWNEGTVIEIMGKCQCSCHEVTQ